MESFSGRVFGYAFGIALGIAFAVALTLVVAWNALSALSVVVAVLASLGISVAIAALIAGYRLPLVWSTRAYRAVMRRLAKRAIRSSIAYVRAPVKCLGIMEREGTVALRIAYGDGDGAKRDILFSVHDFVNHELWGQVKIVEAGESTSLCIPSDIINTDFWEHLEGRMRFDSSPPGVYLVRVLPPHLEESVDELLNDWR